jgi:protein TonB
MTNGNVMGKNTKMELPVEHSGRVISLLQNGVKQCAKNTTLILGAGSVTLCLLGLTTVLIAEEFKPQDKIELAAFDFNADPIELPVMIDRTPPKPLDPIEIPPSPPTLDVPVTERPQEPVTTLTNGGQNFNPDTIMVPTNYKIHTADGDSQPIQRIGPAMPTRADRSGHCRVSFDISPDGKPYNIQANFCSQSHFERPATRSVAKWTYRPEIRDGLPVTRSGMETLIRFNLSDERGNIIPE